MSGDGFSWMHDLNNGLEQAMEKQYAQMGVISSIEKGIGAAMRSMAPTIPALTVIEEIRKSINAFRLPAKTVFEAFERDRRVFDMHTKLQKQYMTIADLHLGPGRLIPDLGINGLTDFIQKQQQLIDHLRLPFDYANVDESSAIVNQAMDAARSLVSGVIIGREWDEWESEDLLEKAEEVLQEISAEKQKALNTFFAALIGNGEPTYIMKVQARMALIGFLMGGLGLAITIVQLLSPSDNPDSEKILCQLQLANTQLAHQQEQLNNQQQEIRELHHELQEQKHQSLVSNRITKLRLKPLKNGRILATIPAGELVRIEDSTDKWLRIIYQDQLGWVLKEHFE